VSWTSKCKRQVRYKGRGSGPEVQRHLGRSRIPSRIYNNVIRTLVINFRLSQQPRKSLRTPALRGMTANCTAAQNSEGSVPCSKLLEALFSMCIIRLPPHTRAEVVVSICDAECRYNDCRARRGGDSWHTTDSAGRPEEGGTRRTRHETEERCGRHEERRCWQASMVGVLSSGGAVQRSRFGAEGEKESRRLWLAGPDPAVVPGTGCADSGTSAPCKASWAMKVDGHGTAKAQPPEQFKYAPYGAERVENGVVSSWPVGAFAAGHCAAPGPGHWASASPLAIHMRPLAIWRAAPFFFPRHSFSPTLPAFPSPRPSPSPHHLIPLMLSSS
jgi:hypothetical protein